MTIDYLSFCNTEKTFTSRVKRAKICVLFFSVALILLGVKIELNWFAYCTRIHYLSQKLQNELFCTQCEYSFDIHYSTDWGTRDILGYFFCAKRYDCKFDLCFANRFMYNKSPAFLRYNPEAFFSILIYFPTLVLLAQCQKIIHITFVFPDYVVCVPVLCKRRI